MKQSILLIETLKAYLRHQGITYRELAKRLNQSESNIKRIFSERSISLSGLEQMCDAIGIELLELARMSEKQKNDVQTFTHTQEKALAKDPKFFSLLYLVLGGVKVRQVLAQYDYKKIECQRYLIQMDKLGLIRLHENDRIEPLVSKNIRWLDGGPLNTLYAAEIKKEFLDSSFSKSDERLRLLNAKLSAHSVQLLSRRLDKLISEFVGLAELDKYGEPDERKTIWLVLGYRPWSFSLFKRYRKS